MPLSCQDGDQEGRHHTIARFAPVPRRGTWCWGPWPSKGAAACAPSPGGPGPEGLLRSRFIALRVRQPGRSIRRACQGRVLPVCWLLAEWPPGENEPTKYWLSTLPADTALPKLVRLAKIRWRVEHDYRELKTALGLAHFEGRTWTGLHHHLATPLPGDSRTR